MALPMEQDPRQPRRRRIRPSGGYRKLRCFQVATIIYDATLSFCDRFVNPRSRTVDQMVQGARSGKQNIAEGSRASAASSQTELRLVTVARGSLDELLLDYQDYLRQEGRRAWTKDDPEAREVRDVGRRLEDGSDSSAYARWLEDEDGEVVANTLVCLIHQANYLLDRQLARLEQDFIKSGGYSEALAVARIAERQKGQPGPGAPNCPACGKPMALRTARKGPRAGAQFWGCSGYPACRRTKALDGSDRSD